MVAEKTFVPALPQVPGELWELGEAPRWSAGRETVARGDSTEEETTSVSVKREPQGQIHPPQKQEQKDLLFLLILASCGLLRGHCNALVPALPGRCPEGPRKQKEGGGMSKGPPGDFSKL